MPIPWREIVRAITRSYEARRNGRPMFTTKEDPLALLWVACVDRFSRSNSACVTASLLPTPTKRASFQGSGSVRKLQLRTLQPRFTDSRSLQVDRSDSTAFPFSLVLGECLARLLLHRFGPSLAAFLAAVAVVCAANGTCINFHFDCTFKMYRVSIKQELAMAKTASISSAPTRTTVTRQQFYLQRNKYHQSRAQAIGFQRLPLTYTDLGQSHESSDDREEAIYFLRR